MAFPININNTAQIRFNQNNIPFAMLAYWEVSRRPADLSGLVQIGYHAFI